MKRGTSGTGGGGKRTRRDQRHHYNQDFEIDYRESTFPSPHFSLIAFLSLLFSSKRPIIKLMLAVFGVCYIAAAAGAYYFTAKRAKSIPFPYWVWEEHKPELELHENIEKAA